MNTKIANILAYSLEIREGQKTYLKDDSILRDKRIIYIDILSTKSHYITLRAKNTLSEFVSKLPTQLLNDNGERILLNQKIDFTKSYIDGTYTQKICIVIYYADDSIRANPYKPISKKQTTPLELVIKGNKTYFSEDSNLTNKELQTLIFTETHKAPSGNNGATDIANRIDPMDATLTLSYRGIEFFKDVPLDILLQTNKEYPLVFDNIKFDLTKSYVSVSNLIRDNNIGNSILFTAIVAND